MPLVLDQAARHRGSGQAGADGVHPDPRAAQTLPPFPEPWPAPRPCWPSRRFRPGRIRAGRPGGDVDDHAAATRLDGGNGKLRAQEHALEIDRYCRIPSGLADVLDFGSPGWTMPALLTRMSSPPDSTRRASMVPRTEFRCSDIDRDRDRAGPLRAQPRGFGLGALDSAIGDDEARAVCRRRSAMAARMPAPPPVATGRVFRADLLILSAAPGFGSDAGLIRSAPDRNKRPYRTVHRPVQSVLERCRPHGRSRYPCRCGFRFLGARNLLTSF